MIHSTLDHKDYRHNLNEAKWTICRLKLKSALGDFTEIYKEGIKVWLNGQSLIKFWEIKDFKLITSFNSLLGFG